MYSQYVSNGYPTPKTNKNIGLGISSYSQKHIGYIFKQFVKITLVPTSGTRSTVPAVSSAGEDKAGQLC